MDKIKILFVQHELLVGGAEKALFDLIQLMDKSKFDITVFAQRNTGPWDKKFRDAGINLIYDYSCRKATFNPVVKTGNIIKKLKTMKAYRDGGKGLLDVCCPGMDIVVSFSAWENEELVFAKGAKTVKYIHGDVSTNTQFRDEALSPQEMLERFDKIVCVSEQARKAFPSRGYSS